MLTTTVKTGTHDILIDWLGCVIDTCDLYTIGILRCQDARGYVYRIGSDVVAFRKDRVKIQTVARGPYNPGKDPV